MNNRKAKIALIHVAKDRCGLKDEHYRLLLQSVCGVESAKDITTDKQVDDIMAAFRDFGFTYTAPPSVEQPPAIIGGTKEQAYKIWELWVSVARDPSYKALRAFVRRIAHVDSPKFLDMELAQKVIIALVNMNK
jgi:phage gp16-like protein